MYTDVSVECIVFVADYNFSYKQLWKKYVDLLLKEK